MRILIIGPCVMEVNGKPVLEVKEGSDVNVNQSQPFDMGGGVVFRTGTRDLATELAAAEREARALAERTESLAQESAREKSAREAAEVERNAERAEKEEARLARQRAEQARENERARVIELERTTAAQTLASQAMERQMRVDHERAVAALQARIAELEARRNEEPPRPNPPTNRPPEG